MCFHTSITSTAQQIEKRSQAKFINDDVKADFEKPHYHLNGFSHPELPLVAQEVSDKILPAVWGIAPPKTKSEELDQYYKKASKFGGGLNARSEKLDSHFLYKSVYRNQRCLIYVDAFFEPHHHKSKSFPYIVKRKDKDMMALAGIYTRFNNGLLTCSIITKAASPFLAEIHNQKRRQPVILDKALEAEWLKPELNPSDILDIINQNYDDSHLEAYPVSKKLHSPKQDSNTPEILEPFNYPELNTLF
jgi:putative SOS response-associated peptidase YedK